MPADLHILQLTRAVRVYFSFLSSRAQSHQHAWHTANPSDVTDNSALATAWHVAGLPRVARESVPIATRLTILFATLKCSEGFAKRQKGITAEICPGRKCVERLYDFCDSFLQFIFLFTFDFCMCLGICC